MGVDYKAVLVIGTPFKASDFIETRVVSKDVCVHPEAVAPGVRFCPVCGTKVSARKATEKREYPLPHVANTIEPFNEMDEQGGEEEGWLEAWLRNDYGGARIGGLNLIDLNDYEARTHNYILGVEVLKTGSSNGGDPIDSTSADALQNTVRDVQTKLGALGLGNRAVHAHCVLVCC